MQRRQISSAIAVPISATELEKHLTMRTTTSSVFVHYRGENYRPRNPYRNRFDGKGMSIAGAVPKWQRPSPRPGVSGAPKKLDDELWSELQEEVDEKPMRRR